MKYYSLDRILKENALYNVIIGERSNGKTYSVLEYGIKQFFTKGTKFAIIRRMQDDFKSKRAASMFSNLVKNGVVSKYSKGKYTHIEYYSGRWYMANIDEETGRLIKEEDPFAYAFALSAMEHDKSTSYPDVKTILFDEFITRSIYLEDEFVLFMNVLSTIIRHRDGIKIFMLGNTVNKYSPYFEEMGLTNISNMKKGSIDLYTYGDSGLTVAVEYAETSVLGKKSDKYFAFNNPKLKMITGGDWELDIYPHLPIKYVPKNKEFEYFIEFGKELLHCEIIEVNSGIFTYIHKKTTPIRKESDLIYTTNQYSHKPNIKRNIKKSNDKLSSKLYDFFINEKVFYQSNEIGEIVRNYLNWCNNLAG